MMHTNQNGRDQAVLTEAGPAPFTVSEDVLEEILKAAGHEDTRRHIPVRN